MWLGGIIMRMKFIIAIIALAVLCVPAFGQTTASEWLDKGLALYDQGKYDEAIQAYDKAIEIDPQNADAWDNKGTTLHKLGKYDEAIQAYDKAIELDYLEDTYAWYNKGLALAKQSKYDEAIQAFDKAIEINPKDADAWNNKGLALGKLGLTAESKAAIDRAKELETEGSTGTPGTISISPNATGTAKDWFDEGNTLYAQGRYDDAIQAFDKAIEIDPQDADVRYNKGAPLYGQKKYGEAIQAYDKAIEIDPQYALAWNYKGLALGILGLTAESNEAIAKAKELGYTGVSEDSIVGKWINRYDWGCTGSSTQGELNFKGDGTLFDDKDGKGKWTRTGDNIHITWDTGPAVYDGTIQTNTMGGL
jgi:tetratricopeptide (TPR) repeat protein